MPRGRAQRLSLRPGARSASERRGRSAWVIGGIGGVRPGGEDPHGELGPRPAIVALYEHVQAKAEPVARRFFVAFSRYELGDRDAGVERALRVNATAAFARELLAAPPRFVAGARPAPATLGRVELVPGHSKGGRLLGAEIVGLTRRDEREEPLSIELEAERGGWRVSGLGR